MVFLHAFHTYIEEYKDPRTDDRWLLRSVWPTLFLCAVYLLLVTSILPAYMKTRRAFNLQTVLVYYNSFQVLLSAYIVYLCYGSGFGSKFSLLQCRDLDSNSDEYSMMGFNGSYLYYLAKFTEFLDTIFFILRKKDKQVTFLHVYHHATMAFNAWLIVKLIPGGSNLLLLGNNALIHVVMYGYYLLAGLGPEWHKYLWWKKHLTAFQIIQFIVDMIIVYIMISSSGHCPKLGMRKYLLYYGFIYLVSLLVLFNKFYKKSYTQSKVPKNMK